MVWYSYLLRNFPQFVVIHTVKGFIRVNEAEVDVLADIFLLRSFVGEQSSRKEKKRHIILNSELILSGITDRIFFLTASVMVKQWFIFPFLKMNLWIKYL